MKTQLRGGCGLNDCLTNLYMKSTNPDPTSLTHRTGKGPWRGGPWASEALGSSLLCRKHTCWMSRGRGRRLHGHGDLLMRAVAHLFAALGHQDLLVDFNVHLVVAREAQQCENLCNFPRKRKPAGGWYHPGISLSPPQGCLQP